MEAPDLLMICVAAFSAVFVLLIILALVMRITILLFPETKKKMEDAAVLAAVATVMSSLYPDTKVDSIKEIK
jgi:hypothetical protein